MRNFFFCIFWPSVFSKTLEIGWFCWNILVSCTCTCKCWFLHAFSKRYLAVIFHHIVVVVFLRVITIVVIVLLFCCDGCWFCNVLLFVALQPRLNASHKTIVISLKFIITDWAISLLNSQNILSLHVYM